MVKYLFFCILAVVDQNLVSWVLLFLSRSLDCASPGWSSEENIDKGATTSSSREKESQSLFTGLLF